MARRKVTFAKLHSTNTFLPGLGNIGDTLPPKNKTVPGLEIYAEDGCLFITAPAFRAFIPLTNVQIAMFVDEPAPAEAAPSPVKLAVGAKR